MSRYVRNTVAFLMGLAVPLSAYAQPTLPQQTQQPIQTMPMHTPQHLQTMPTPQTSQGAQQTAPLQQAPMQSAQALLTQPAYSSGEVIVGVDAATSQLPQLTLGVGNTRITVVNPGPTSVRFSSPTIGLNQEIPANAQRTIWIDAAMVSNLTPGQQFAYYINDMQGNQIASSTLQVNTSTMLAIGPTPILATETKKEPTYTSEKTRPTTRRSTVRGYW